MTVKEEIFKGLGASKGIAIGKPFIYHVELPTYDAKPDGSINLDKEIEEYELAIEQSKKELNKI